MSYYIPDSDFDYAINNTLLPGDMQNVWDTTKDERNFKSHLDPEIIARERERAMRAKLVSTDGNTAETYDQFYRDHKLLLKLFQILAVMPIVRSAPGMVTFHWKSAATYYAVGFYSVMSILVLIVGYERIKILQTIKEFDEYIYAILFVMFLVPHFWIPFVGWGVASDVAKYKTMWGTFQVRYFRVTGTTLVFPRLKVLIVILFIGCLLCAILFLLSLSLLLEGFPLWHTSAYYHIITMINMNCALWYINTRGIKEASKSLSRSFRNNSFELLSSVASANAEANVSITSLDLGRKYEIKAFKLVKTKYGLRVIVYFMDNTYVYLPPRFAEKIKMQRQVDELNQESKYSMVFEGQDEARGGFLKIKFVKEDQ